MDKNNSIPGLGNNHEMPASIYGFIFHYYRAEVYRETNWRNRLDNTTNWSIVTSAAFLTFVFANQHVPHSVILINFLIVWFFMYVESRRFRYYSILRDRTRLIEKQLLGPVFTGQASSLQEKDWQKKLAESFNKPQIGMSRLESITWRLRRSYIIIFPMLFLAWITKIYSYPIMATNINQLFENARVLFIPGQVVFFCFAFFQLLTIGLALYIPHRSHNDDLP